MIAEQGESIASMMNQINASSAASIATKSIPAPVAEIKVIASHFSQMR